jgi:PTS system D-glucosamine-specific IIC component
MMKQGNAIQIIYGPTVTVIKSNLEDYLNSHLSDQPEKILKNAKIPKKAPKTHREKIYQPIKGEVVPLDQVEDEVFSDGLLGEGFAIRPAEGRVVSPVEGTVSVVFDTKHAIGIISKGGAEILIHVGINTVRLKGEYFDAKVEPGMKVSKGDLLMEFDLDAIREAGYVTTVPIVISNTMDYTSVT